jgi:parallel beta-helix repeat protein
MPTSVMTQLRVQPDGDIAAVINNAQPGTMIIVPPGIYGPLIFPSGNRGPMVVFADVTAQLSPESAPGAVVIDARDGPVALDISGQSSIVIDGVTARGATDAGVRVSGSQNITIQNCTVKHNTGDGIRFENSVFGAVFDNLVFANDGTGISTVGTSNLRAINNTAVENGNGILIGDASSAILFENNIIYHNTQVGIGVVASDAQGNFNLNTDSYLGIQPGPNDRTKDNIPGLDPLFRFPDTVHSEDVGFFLSTGSPAIDAGDLNTDVALLDVIQPPSCPTGARCDRVTQVDGQPDEPPVDLGFHYPELVLPQPTPTPVPVNTSVRKTPTRTGSVGATPTPKPTRTVTPTRTPK